MIDQRIIQISYVAAFCIGFIQVGKKNHQHCCLQLIQTAVPSTRDTDMVFLGPTILPQLPEALCSFIASRDDCAPIAKRSKVLGRIKAEAGSIAKSTYSFPINQRSVGLSTILQQSNSALPTQPGYGLDVPHSCTIEVSDNNCIDAHFNCLLDFGN